MSQATELFTIPTIRMALQKAIQEFSKAGFESPDVEARYLLAGVLHCSSSALILHSDDVLDDHLMEQFEGYVARRLNHEPAAYITGVKHFLGLEFSVNNQVLIPRPETELLVEDVLMEIRDSHVVSPRVLDVGTGSGCVAVSLAKFAPNSQVFATEISTHALRLAKENATKNIVAIDFFHGDLMAGLPPEMRGGFDMIVSNPPYIVSSVLPRLQPEISFEPRLALDGGESGIEVLKRLIEEGFLFLKSNGLLAMEIGHDQGESVRNLLIKTGFEKITVLKDYSGLDRIAKGKKSGPI